MKIISILLLLVFFSSSCANLEKFDFNSSDSKEVYTTFISKEIEINFNEDGKFVGVKISVSEKVKIDLPGFKEIATSKALIKAKNILSGFIDKSGEQAFFNHISKTLKIVENKENSENNTALVLSNEMKKNKNYILKSLYIERETYYRETKMVSLITRSSTKFKKTTNKIKNLFKKNY